MPTGLRTIRASDDNHFDVLSPSDVGKIVNGLRVASEKFDANATELRRLAHDLGTDAARKAGLDSSKGYVDVSAMDLAAIFEEQAKDLRRLYVALNCAEKVCLEQEPVQ